MMLHQRMRVIEGATPMNTQGHDTQHDYNSDDNY